MTRAQAVVGARVWFFDTRREVKIPGTIVRVPYRVCRGRWAVVIAPDGWRTNRRTLNMSAFMPLRSVHLLKGAHRVRSKR